MAFDESLAARVRLSLHGSFGLKEKKMFGGVCFMLYGNILVGVWQTSLIVRLGQEAAAQALKERHVKPFDITGKPMKGWVMVEPAGLADEKHLQLWVERALAFVNTLPAK